jgi:hypothetical protein
MPNWVCTFENDGDYMESIEGILWADAPLPRKRHHCTPQTRGWFGVSYVERCACGAIRGSRYVDWEEKNRARKDRRKNRS